MSTGVSIELDILRGRADAAEQSVNRLYEALEAAKDLLREARDMIAAREFQAAVDAFFEEWPDAPGDD